jgi:hypothetical protein
MRVPDVRLQTVADEDSVRSFQPHHFEGHSYGELNPLNA